MTTTLDDTPVSAPVDGAGTLEKRMSRSLYELASDLQLVEEALPEASDDEAVDLLQQFFDQTSADLDDKLDRYCELIQEFGARSEARLKESKRLGALGHSDARQAERMKAALLWFLQTRDIRKKETIHFKLSRQQNGGQQPVELLVEPERLPDDLRYVTYAAHTDALREQLLAAADRLQELTLNRKLLHSLSGLPADRLELLTGILRQLGQTEAQIREINATAEARGFSNMPPGDVDRLARLTSLYEDLAGQAEEIETFSAWSDDHRQQLHAVEAALGGPPWCYATFRPRGEHIRIR